MTGEDELIRRLKRSTFDEVMDKLVVLNGQYLSELRKLADPNNKEVCLKKHFENIDRVLSSEGWTIEEFNKEHYRRNT